MRQKLQAFCSAADVFKAQGLARAQSTCNALQLNGDIPANIAGLASEAQEATPRNAAVHACRL